MGINRNLGLKILGAFFFVFLTAASFAAPVAKQEAYGNLTSLKHRPSVQEVEHAFGGKIPSPLETGIRPSEWANLIMQNIPRAIAKMERIYPGAIWASLGRDAVSLADIFESFYLSIGQPGRVVRVNASSGSFDGTNPQMFVQMLKDIGMDIDNSETMRPFIIFDNTSYNQGSQSTQLIRMVYDYYTNKTHRPIEHLFEKVAMFSVCGGIRTVDRNDFFKTLCQSSRGMTYPSGILHVPEGMGFMYRTEWHGTFGPLVTYPDGRVGGRITYDGDPASKRLILDEMIEGYYAASSFEFLQAVRAEAKNIGYDFDEHIKTYSKDWIPPKFVPRQPFNEELVDAGAKAFLKSFINEKQFLPITKPLRDYYIAHVSQGLNDAEESLNHYKEENKLNDDQLTKHKRKLIAQGFEKVDSSIHQSAKELNLQPSQYEYLMLAFLKTLSKYEPYEKTYFSTNAKQLNDLNRALMTGSPLMEYVISYLRLMEVALNDGLISSKDYRRLILHALSFVSKEKSFYEALPKLFTDSPKLQRYLIKHAQVYLTSKKNGKAAQAAYLEMIKRNLLPKPNDCDLWLSGKALVADGKAE